MRFESHESYIGLYYSDEYSVLVVRPLKFQGCFTPSVMQYGIRATPLLLVTLSLITQKLPDFLTILLFLLRVSILYRA